MANRSWAEKGGFSWWWLVGLFSRDSMGIDATVACREASGHLPGGHFSVAGWPNGGLGQTSRAESPHSPGPRVMDFSEGSARGTRPGQSCRRAEKAQALIRWYAGCSRGNQPPKGAA
jgi:hypothetical protein